MADTLEAIDNLPDISFIDDMTLEDVQSLLINKWQEYYKQITGKKITLARADPNRLILYACASVIYQGLQQVDKAGKMNFLKYAYGDYLKNLAALKNVTENEPERATVRVRWSLAGARESATSIPAGSRVTADNEVYFESTEYNEIPAGDTEIIITMQATTTGEQGNGYMAGEISINVDEVAFIESVANIETSAGGTGEESDQSIAERAFLAPSSYSTAGPDDAYIYWAKTYDSEIGDVVPLSPTPGVVNIRFILSDGSIPGETLISGLQNYLQQRGKRPLTDNVIVQAPDAVKYNINVTYYINSSDSASAVQIQEQADQAIGDYQTWQSEKIGRDINPDELRRYLKDAGVKRTVVTEPVFTVLKETEIAVLGTINLVYGGLEDD
jgi:phage-related baseplate assembly protein